MHESKVKSAAGLTSEIDVYTAQAEMERATLHLLDARNAVAKAKAAGDRPIARRPPSAPST